MLENRRGGAGVRGRGNETVWAIASSRSASSPWSTKVGGIFVGTGARCDWRRRLGEWSALRSAHRRHRTGVGRRIHGGYQAFKLSASSCKATLLDQIGTEFGLWRPGRVGMWAMGRGSSWLVKQDLEANTSDLDDGCGSEL